MPRPCRVSLVSQLHRSAAETVVSFAKEFDALDIRRDFGWQRRLRLWAKSFCGQATLGSVEASEPQFANQLHGGHDFYAKGLLQDKQVAILRDQKRSSRGHCRRHEHIVIGIPAQFPR